MKKPTIALFLNHPECSKDCVDGMTQALSSHYKIKTFGVNECNSNTFKDVDIVAFPGGIGDATSYDRFFRRQAQNAVADFVENGGRYLGICMGAYWAGSYFFDILDGVDAVQYIKQPCADIKRSYSTYASVTWRGQPEDMFFYDGCALVGDNTRFQTVATYANGDAMAIIQNRVGIIGCHPESQKHWYEKPRQYLLPKWHEGRHHKLLLEFVNELMRH
jgi:GMP synthase-like glutamine amidotransferase